MALFEASDYLYLEALVKKGDEYMDLFGPL